METLTLTDTLRQRMEAIFRAQQAHAPALARTTARERIAKLKKIDAYLRDAANMQRLVAAMQADFRKPEVEVLATETGVVQTHLAYVRRHLRRWMRPRRVATPLPLVGTTSHIHYEPKGVCLVLAPWNYPLNLALVPLVYAIAAGNAAIVKPSEISAHTSAFIREMIADLFEEREVAVVEGDAAVAQALLELPFNHVFFTGSPRVGKAVMAAAARHLASVTLELGGKSPAVVDATVNLRTAAERAVWAKCLNTGQTCIAPDYLIVHESVADAFAREYGEAVRRLYDPEGKGVRQSADFPRIISPAHFQRLRRLFDDAVEKGARVELGGEFAAGERFVAPTLLSGVTEEMAIMEEEIFGPIMPMVTYRRREEIVDIIRRRPKPLTLYIASRDRALSDYLLRETSAGGTVVNEYMLGYSNPNLPFGGVNNSGIGKSMGFHGFVEFSNERAVIRRRWGTLKMIYPPYTQGVKRLVEWLYKLV